MPGVEDLDLPLPHHRELARAAALWQGTAACSSLRSPFTNWSWGCCWPKGATQPRERCSATALEHSLVVVPRNLADFGATGVPLLNPWQQG